MLLLPPPGVGLPGLKHPPAIPARGSPFAIADVAANEACQPGRRLTPQVFAAVGAGGGAATTGVLVAGFAATVAVFFGETGRTVPFACASARAAAAAAAFTARSFRFRLADRDSFSGSDTSSATNSSSGFSSGDVPSSLPATTAAACDGGAGDFSGGCSVVVIAVAVAAADGVHCCGGTGAGVADVEALPARRATARYEATPPPLPLLLSSA